MEPYEEILQTIYTFVPAGIDPKTDYDAYLNSPQIKRLAEKWAQEYDDTTRWDDFYDLIAALFGPSMVAEVTSPTGMDRCRQVVVNISHNPYRVDRLVINWSIIGPFYEIYRSKAELAMDGGKSRLINQRSSYDTNPYWGPHLADEIQELYGYNQLSPFASSMIIPDIALPYTGFGEVTLAKALFTDIVM
ncbi:hypothetical protein [Chitinophaga sp. CB10]|uniref:hypothetical protein n=1 Tax=Chitinophaga sp. CB10 TaxID=1891659 RepID=UPI0025C124D1|nr:hypothetical protein [Chitinophaga sp. CB10]